MAEICNFLPQVDQQCKPKSYQVDFRTRSLPEFKKKIIDTLTLLLDLLVQLLITA